MIAYGCIAFARHLALSLPFRSETEGTTRLVTSPQTMLSRNDLVSVTDHIAESVMVLPMWRRDDWIPKKIASAMAYQLRRKRAIDKEFKPLLPAVYPWPQAL